MLQNLCALARKSGTNRFSTNISADVEADVTVIGAGVVGLAVAAGLAKAGCSVWVLEKNSKPGQETSSRNSEVIHAGIYYPPGSLKARLCVAGKHLLYKYVREHGIAHSQLGKLIVGQDDSQLKRLEALHQQAHANSVTDCRLISGEECQALEPHVRAAGAMLSPSTGIVDSHSFMECLQGDIQQAGSEVATNVKFVSAAPAGNGLRVQAQDILTGDHVSIHTAHLVNCAGLQAHRVCQQVDGFPQECVPRVYFSKGNYFSISGPSPFRHLIYPMPSDGGLGVHLTLDLAGQMRVGPDSEWLHHSDPEAVNYDVAAGRREAFEKSLREYWPGASERVLHADYSGVRTKLSAPGQPNADFHIQAQAEHGIPGLVNLFGIESPGLTSSLGISEYIINEHFQL